MANEEHVRRLKDGVAGWNEWRENSFEKPDLRGANLSKTSFDGTDFRAANLAGANFREAHLGSAIFTNANLMGANFRSANLIGASLDNANLIDADFNGAELTEASFAGANITGANFTEALAAWTILADLDLTKATGLETVDHQGPSTVGIDTIYRSGGKIPEVFLRGAGVPETFITYVGSLVGKPIQFYSCFISYSTKDQDFAERLHADLQAKGVRCWFAPHQMAGGKKVHEQIDEAIRVYDRLLLILSPHSMESEWVKTEIAKARKREIGEKRRMLFPVGLVDYETLRGWECFDGDTGKDSAREIREYFIPDFSRWKEHDSYRLAFERLLRDLKSEKLGPA